MGKVILFLLIFIYICPSKVYSQISHSLFFFHDNPQSAVLNPAKLTGKGKYFDLPILFPLGFNLYSSHISYNDFIARDPARNDSLVINKEVLNILGPDNEIFLELRKPLFVYGWGNEKQSFELQLGVNSYSVVDFSKNLMALLMDGNEQFVNQKIIFNKEKFELNSWGELSLGYARKLKDNFTIGGRLKTLIGIANVHTRKLDFSMQTDNEIYKMNIFSDILIQSAGLGNVFKNPGLAADLGFVYKIPSKRIEFSASVLDLGFIRWQNNVSAITSTTNGKVFEFKGITGVYDQSIQEITDSLKRQMEVTTTSGGAYSTYLPPKIILSMSYCPHGNGEIGILYNYKFGKSFTSIVYTNPLNSWLRISVSNTSHFRSIVNPGMGVEINIKNFQWYGFVEDVNSLWLNKTKNISVLTGINIFLSKNISPNKSLLTKPM